MKLILQQQPEVPLEAEVLSPATLSGIKIDDVPGLTLFYGNQKVPLGDFFSVADDGSDTITVEGDLSRVKLIGSDMSAGQLVVNGSVGAHLGAGMSGGLITVEGDAGDWVGRDMSGGRIVVKGRAGHLIGSAIRGSNIGMLGGEILIHGDVGNEIGNAMRRGLIAVGGGCGDFAAVNMLAGTVIVLGEMGIHGGASMKRGSLISMCEAKILPTFTYACRYQPIVMRPLLLHLRSLGMSIDDAWLSGFYKRWSGDAIEKNRGEILIYQAE